MAKQSRTFWKYFLMGLMVFVAVDICARILLIVAASFGPCIFAENIHCRHDPILGWSHIPGISIPNMYGPDKDLTINSQGFRAKHDFTRLVESGKTRIICLGDSFTLGYGVGDDETFSSNLEASSPGLEVLNMGQGGYGLDQMYLWYRMEWSKYSHKILLVCFIDADISRMNADRFDIYAKPWMQVEAQRLHPMNIPAPDFNQGFWDKTAWWSGLGAVQVAARVRESLIRRETPKGIYQTQTELLKTVLSIFGELDALAKSQDATMAIVRLPTAGNVEVEIPFYTILGKEIEVTGYPYFDLVQDFRQLDGYTINRMFIDENTAPKELLRFKGMGAHYSPFGHSLVTKWIYGDLIKENLVQGKIPDERLTYIAQGS
ncbi:MAG: hypothetical protein JEZ02_11990 [Desulfatibacillum sp.]|nr:hypothetical protein [Desulfatibacillum sp.]